MDQQGYTLREYIMALGSFQFVFGIRSTSIGMPAEAKKVYAALVKGLSARLYKLEGELPPGEVSPLADISPVWARLLRTHQL